MEELPPNALAGEVYKSDLGERVVQRPTLQNQVIAFPYYTKPYDNPDLHKAISMAINREEITKTIFEGSRTPADGFVHPLIQGYQPNACGEFCTFDPTKAKDYLAKSGFTGKLELRSNTDGGHQEWAEAVCNSIKNSIGLDCVFVPVTSFAEHRQKVNAHTMESMYRAGWIADYPHIENWLNPLYRTGASSNDGLYTNPAVDAKLAEADRATSEDKAIALYREAEKLIAQDMPGVPLWTQHTIAGRSEKLKFAKLTPFHKRDLASVEIA
jgi:oligopeptide transport system substrate-binding protein